MLKVQQEKQDEFSGALLWTGENTGTRKYKLLTLFASLSVVTFTVFQGGGGGGPSNVVNISRRIVGPGELFSSDFRACARSPHWKTRCLSQLQLRCSNSITGPQASSSRSELSAK